MCLAAMLVVVGDTPYDAPGACKAQLQTIGMLSGAGVKRTCAKLAASQFIATPRPARELRKLAHRPLRIATEPNKFC
jgi:phosphoglycolate phosphatase-like HAD superfamily hydrolase